MDPFSLFWPSTSGHQILSAVLSHPASQSQHKTAFIDDIMTLNCDIHVSWLRFHPTPPRLLPLILGPAAVFSPERQWWTVNGVRVALRVRELAPGIMNRVMTGEEFRGGSGQQCCVDLERDRQFGENGGTVVGMACGAAGGCLISPVLFLSADDKVPVWVRGERPCWGGAPLDLCAELCGHGSSRNASCEETEMTESPVLQRNVRCVSFLNACAG